MCLYSLILGSKLPTARRSKRWVTSEVLPSIRRHGLYAIGDYLTFEFSMVMQNREYLFERGADDGKTE